MRWKWFVTAGILIIDVKARLTGKNFATLGPVLEAKLPEAEAFDVSGHLRGSGDLLRLDNINGNLSGSSINIVISGSVGNLIAFNGVDLQMKSSGKDLAVMGRSLEKNYRQPMNSMSMAG